MLQILLIRCLNIARRDCLNKYRVLCRITNTVEASGVVTHRVLKDSLAQSIRRHRANLRDAAAILSLLVIEEVEGTVAHDLATGGSAELIPHQRLPGHSGLVVEPG